ncbi:aminomethyl-transferring glycine dehydrogenase subunit GcvPB [Legionella pneumophila]|uniref:Probable glycine dehydrogenase (decarboxylating) subunit 2 n=1 Tax=Legionella pneumophila subsp. pascullei TaxID=91890 RepID=A0AAX2ISW7_LEGPN|nr:aminomethyl-transferring glycine dehydrogenase subunit GcvPB [Legionella pneumophila]AMP88282.1 glycine dehydrogenase (aminomethyl-transferring) [Legionella pneumophila subsp. pascullei]AMP91191.1 glycine dehydrogenase [Legionella pneumophila subsp. pascullei]AMP94178.1 glycine dehydrogenase [Legionella pneumophila subsp. pascullei]SQG88951.1 glycine dehydrogenase subunit 2 [Legionella pneumophila subsp. pascullei]VEH04001.1 glycine dehydrogenase subunit 2 [Legionella pneumophila subsp. pas
MLIFELSKTGRQAKAQIPRAASKHYSIPDEFQRKSPPKLPACSELQVVRHFTRLSQKNFSIDTNFYPLGSCTMKYNPRGVHKAASLPGFINRHPLAMDHDSQGFLETLYKLQNYISEITGMPGVSLTPMAGSQGEFAGVAMIKAYHQSRGDTARDEILIPDAAHGTNPASAVMCGFKVVEIATAADGDIDLDELKRKVGPRTAGIMLTNPSTLGLFMRQIKEIASLVHQAGGLLYYDGANLNAILGKVRPGDMGFDVMHLNLHKTFATPHGGGGPGAGPVAVGKRLIPYMPLPIVKKTDSGYHWATRQDYPQSIGRLSCFMGNAGILLRAYFYMIVLGKEGLLRVSEFATLNANYLLKELTKVGYTAAYPGRRASHEFILTLNSEKKNYDVTAMDFAKRLLDYGVHAPTTYFPLLVPECLLIEPPETESKEELDAFVAVMKTIREEAIKEPDLLKAAPHTLPVRRLDDVKAARELDLNYFATHE